MSTGLDTLRKQLDKQHPGAVPDNVLTLLRQVWDELEGSNYANMESFKLHRAENMVWDPPLLSFMIERHGARALGSTRAELQYWTVDVNKGTATLERKYGYRQVEPRDKPLDCDALAREVRDKILAGEEDERLVYRSYGRIKVKVGETVGANFNQTRADRRRRFHKALCSYMEQAGWSEVGEYLYQPPSDTGDE